MAGKSKVKRLPKAQRKDLDKLIADGTHTVDELHDAARTMGADVSRSSLWRYARQYARMAGRIEESAAIARAMLDEMREFDGVDMSHVVLMGLQTQIFQRLADTGDAPLDPKERKALIEQSAEIARALRHMPSVRREDGGAVEPSPAVRAFLAARHTAADQAHEDDDEQD